MVKNVKIVNGPIVQQAEKSVAPLEKYTKIIDGPMYSTDKITGGPI